MATDTSGFYNGRHYTKYVEDVKALKRAGDLNRAEALLLALVEAVENEARANRWSVAPWYYDQLAIIYRKTKQPGKELRILERYASHWSSKDGPLPTSTATSIERARQRAIPNAPDQARTVAPLATAPAVRRRVTCQSCRLEHESLTRCPRCGAKRNT